MSAIGPGQTHNFNIDAAADLGVSVSSISDEAVGLIQQELEGIADAAEEVIFGSWPVDTGRSLAAWRVFVEGLVLHVENPVEYASWVHPAGTAGTTSADELGLAARQIKTEIDIQWAQRSGRIARIIDQDKAQQQTSLNFRNIASAAAGLAARETLQGEGLFFDTLRSIYTISRIQERERGRPRSRARAR